MPAAVVRARNGDEVAAAVAAAGRLGVPVTPRAGGSSVAGQCLGTGLIVDVAALAGVEAAEEGWETVWAGAGETLDELNAELAPAGRGIGPDVMSSQWARVGGLVATNACGSRSLRYGRFDGALLEAEVVLADGARATLGRGATPGPVADGLEAALDGLDSDLAEWPRQPREPGGYRLPALAGERDALSVLAGSEGTLCVITRARLATVEVPRRRSLAIASFDSLADALAAAPALAAGASAVEVLDERLSQGAREHGLDAIREGAAALVVEELDEEGASRAVAGELASAAEVVHLDGEDAELAWRLRGAALSLAGGDGRAGDPAARGGKLALACFEDPAVPPERVAGFCTELLAGLRRFGLDAIVYGHAGAGCLHVRPLCDPADPRLGERLLDATAAVGDLVGEYGGALTGEHGWGLSRSHLVERTLGPRSSAASRP